jgi:hypothetical protein
MSEDSAGLLFLLFSLVLLPSVCIFVTRPPLKHLWTVASSEVWSPSERSSWPVVPPLGWFHEPATKR